MAKGRKSEGAWIARTAQAAASLPGDCSPLALTDALMRADGDLSRKMASRMASAFLSVQRLSKGAPMVASIVVCELLARIVRLDPSAVGDLVEPALSGDVPASALRERMIAVTARIAAGPHLETVTIDELVARCPERQADGGVRQIEIAPMQHADRVLVDAAVYDHEPVKINHRHTVGSWGLWALLVSPHVPCARVRAIALDAFIDRVCMAFSFYTCVSVICASGYERDLIKPEVAHPTLYGRAWIRTI